MTYYGDDILVTPSYNYINYLSAHGYDYDLSSTPYGATQQAFNNLIAHGYYDTNYRATGLLVQSYQDSLSGGQYSIADWGGEGYLVANLAYFDAFEIGSNEETIANLFKEYLIDNSNNLDLLKLVGGVEGHEGTKVQDFMSQYCAGSIRSKMPGQFLDMTIGDVLALKTQGDRDANTCIKLLSRDEYRK
jgi:hypothetical protein